ncbi:hypothetical protein ZWY2020_052460 [Hordeum vulgare]|nr:hypothetical protein ZWY2020_052460 [Hordeum vulgare]
MCDQRIDIIAIQETMRTEFSLSELEPLSFHLFASHRLPSNGTTGHSDGILLGVKDATFEVGSMDRGEFYVSMELFEWTLNFKWEVIVVYGSANHRLSRAFFDEVSKKVSATQLLVVVGGDFNLICLVDDESNNLVNLPRMHLFNDRIRDLGLRVGVTTKMRPFPYLGGGLKRGKGRIYAFRKRDNHHNTQLKINK